MAYTEEFSCPYDDCGAPFVVEIDRDSDYGSDADGNRGVGRTTLEIVEQSCDCKITDEMVERMVD